MRLNPPLVRRPFFVTQAIPGKNSHSSALFFEGGCGSPQASEEIYAYIATRDLSLAQAERETTDLTLNRAFLANELVESCLKPARSPYQAQSLPETEARRERERCQLVKSRIAQLRACCAVAA